MKLWTCFLPFQMYLRCHESLPTQSPVVAQEKTYSYVCCDVLWEGTAEIWGARANVMRQLVGKVVPRHLFSWRKSKGVAGAEILLTSGWHFSFLPMMFCWLHHTLTSSVWVWSMVPEISRLPPLFCFSFTSPSTVQPSQIKWVSFIGCWSSPSETERGAETSGRISEYIHDSFALKVDVVWASGQDALWALSCWGMLGVPKWEDTLGQTQKTLETLHRLPPGGWGMWLG